MLIGCKSNQERADKILELLREKGLEGDPTLIKCRELKKQILTKKEIDDLDPSVILNTEGRIKICLKIQNYIFFVLGRTRRSTAARTATKRSYTFEEEDGAHKQQIIAKLKRVVDSDSDFGNE